MSKYYKAEDVIRAIDDAFDSIPMEQTIEILQARRNIRNLPTIEVSEDAVSRADLIESFLADCECESREEARAATLNLEDMLELIDDAPSVIPQPEEKPKIRKRINKPFRAVWLDDNHNEIGNPQTDEIGDCNICRFAGCSECDDCINGSEWVRMVDYLEDVDDE